MRYILSLLCCGWLYGEALVSVKLLPEYVEFDAGELTVAVEFGIQEGWHIYGDPPGETGLPTKIDWKLPGYIRLMKEEWPKTTRFSSLGIKANGYEKSFVVLARFAVESVPVDMHSFQANISWLACEDACVPGEASLFLEIPRGPPIKNSSFPDIKPEKLSFRWVYLLWAFIGGMILNLMPCVFPIIGIKILHFLEIARHKQSIVFRHGLAFFAGIWVSFLALGGLLVVLRGAGESLGWGFQLQSPLFVAFLILLFFFISLNLLSVFEFHWVFQGKLQEGNFYLTSFLSGCLATLVATPCTAPFMGVALGVAFTQTNVLTFAIFSFLAFGMGVPYLILTLFPQILKHLPRPGPWMEVFKQILAFPLIATVIWLIWVLGQQTDIHFLTQILFALLLLSLAMWIQGKWGLRSVALKWVSRVLLIVSLGIAFWHKDVSPYENAWQDYDKTRLEVLLENDATVFVDFTAAWCLTCQVNKHTTLNKPAVQKALIDKNIILMHADWTFRNPEMTKEINRLGRSGVPVYALYFPNGKTYLFPEILTPDLFLEKLREAKQLFANSKKAEN